MSNLFTECDNSLPLWSYEYVHRPMYKPLGIIVKIYDLSNTPSSHINLGFNRVDILNLNNNLICHYRIPKSIDKCKSCKWGLRQVLGKCYVRYLYEEFVNEQGKSS